MKFIQIMLLTCFCAVTMIACKNDKKKESTEDQIKEVVSKSPGINAGTGSFSIEAPEGWTKKDTNYSGLQTTMLFSPQAGDTDDFIENVNVVTEKVGDISAQTYMDKNLEIMQKQLPGFKNQSSKNLSIDGEDAKMVSYVTVMNGRALAMQFYLLVKNGIAYGITCCSKDGETKDWETPFHEAVKSFHVL